MNAVVKGQVVESGAGHVVYHLDPVALGDHASVLPRGISS